MNLETAANGCNSGTDGRHQGARVDMIRGVVCMSIEIHIDNGHQWTMDELPPRTIALDGAVAGPHLDPVHQRYSFDHHANCLRLITRASCEQVFDALLLGLDPSGMKVLHHHLHGTGDSPSPRTESFRLAQQDPEKPGMQPLEEGGQVPENAPRSRGR